MWGIIDQPYEVAALGCYGIRVANKVPLSSALCPPLLSLTCLPISTSIPQDGDSSEGILCIAPLRRRRRKPEPTKVRIQSASMVPITFSSRPTHHPLDFDDQGLFNRVHNNRIAIGALTSHGNLFEHHHPAFDYIASPSRGKTSWRTCCVVAARQFR